MRIASGMACVFGMSLLAAQGSQPTSATRPTPLTITGRVVDVRGDGIALARVRITELTERATTLAEGTCDGEGFFLVPGVPPGRALSVEGSRTGFATGSAMLSNPQHPVRVMLSEAAKVQGILRDAKGQPVAGAIVCATSELIQLTGARSTATTAADGRFTLAAVALGANRVESLAPSGGLAEQRLTVDGDRELALAIAPEQTTSVRIEVRGVPPELLDRVRLGILLQRGNRGAMLPPPADVPKLAKDGVCTVSGLPARAYRVQIVLPGFAFSPQDARLEANGGPHEVVFRAKALASGSLRLTALVRDPRGKPIGGIPLDLRVGREVDSTAISDSEGRVEFTTIALAGTKVSLGSSDPAWIVAPTTPSGALLPLPVVSGRHEFVLDPRSVREVTIWPACKVSGRVQEDAGDPAAHRLLVLEHHAERRIPAWLEIARTTTDRRGVFEFSRVQKGIGTLRVRGGGTTGEPFSLRDEDPVTEVGTLRLAPSATVEGTVTSAQGVPLPGRRVVLHAWDAERNTIARDHRVEVLTDRGGRYRIRGAPLGAAVLHVVVDESTDSDPQAEPFDVVAGTVVTRDLRGE